MGFTSQPSGSIPKPDLNAWLTASMRDYLALTNCISHGTIQSFDVTKQTAVVAVNYLRVIKNANPNLPNPAPNDQTTDVFLGYPLLLNVPVIILRGGASSLTFPIIKGDPCLLLFNDKEIDTWLTTGQVNAPQKLRIHDLSDAWALVGISNFLKPLKDYYTDAIYLKSPSVKATENFEVGNGATGTFVSGDGKVVTVTQGIIISIV